MRVIAIYLVCPLQVVASCLCSQVPLPIPICLPLLWTVVYFSFLPSRIRLSALDNPKTRYINPLFLLMGRRKIEITPITVGILSILHLVSGLSLTSCWRFPFSFVAYSTKGTGQSPFSRSVCDSHSSCSTPPSSNSSMHMYQELLGNSSMHR